MDRLLDAILALPVSRNKPQCRGYQVQDHVQYRAVTYLIETPTVLVPRAEQHMWPNMIQTQHYRL